MRGKAKRLAFLRLAWSDRISAGCIRRPLRRNWNTQQAAIYSAVSIFPAAAQRMNPGLLQLRRPAPRDALISRRPIARRLTRIRSAGPVVFGGRGRARGGAEKKVGIWSIAAWCPLLGTDKRVGAESGFSRGRRFAQLRLLGTTTRNTMILLLVLQEWGLFEISFGWGSALPAAMPWCCTAA